MKAIEFKRYGPAEELQIVEREKPRPGPGEVLIRIHSTAVNSGDWRVRKADPFLVRLFFGLFRPKKSARILGSVLSGVVEAVGEDVKRLSAGQAVFGMSDLALGCHAEYICLPEKAPVVQAPAGFSHEELASIPFGLHTAHHFLKSIPLETGMRVLIIGASGAVGSAAVQLAHAAGCDVTAVTSGSNAKLAKDLGAGRVVDYRTQSLEDLDPFDVVFESVDRTETIVLRRLVKPGGHLVLVAAGLKDMLLASLRSGKWGIRIHTGVATVTPDEMELFARKIQAGEYRPVLEKIYPFEAVVEAHRHAEKGHKKGNIALSFTANP